MPMSEARKRSREVKGQPVDPPAELAPLQIRLLGHDVVMDVFSLTIDEKQTWRRYTAELGPGADETDHMVALAAVLIQRHDPSVSWAMVRSQVTWRTMLAAVKNGTPAEPDHPQ